MASGYTQAQLTALQQALASGVLSVSYAGHTATYRSVADLKEAIRIVKAGLAEDAGTVPVRRVVFQTSKGV